MAIAFAILLSFSVYSWLLYAIFKVPTVWVISVMTPAALFTAVAASFGYRQWLVRNARDNKQATFEASVKPLTIALYIVALGGLAWSTIYLIWRGLTMASLLTGAGTATIALYGLIHLNLFYYFPTASTAISKSGEGAGPVFLQGFRVFMLALCTIVIPVMFAVVLLIDHQFKSAVVLFAISSAILAWTVRKIRTELWESR